MSHLLRGYGEEDSFEGAVEEPIHPGRERERQRGTHLSEEDCDRLWIDVGGEG